MTRRHHSRRNLSLTAFGQAGTGRGLIVALVLALSACATHQDSPTGAARFERADADHDGKLSRDEISDYLVIEMFDARDVNHDGRMTPEEWIGHASFRAAEFQKRDANQDGIVTKEEAIKYGRAHGVANNVLRDGDKNHDGGLDKAEMQAYKVSREDPSDDESAVAW